MTKRKAKKIIQDHRHAAGYRKTPEGAAWSKVSVKLLSRVLQREKW